MTKFFIVLHNIRECYPISLGSEVSTIMKTLSVVTMLKSDGVATPIYEESKMQ